MTLLGPAFCPEDERRSHLEDESILDQPFECGQRLHHEDENILDHLPESEQRSRSGDESISE